MTTSKTPRRMILRSTKIQNATDEQLLLNVHTPGMNSNAVTGRRRSSRYITPDTTAELSQGPPGLPISLSPSVVKSPRRRHRKHVQNETPLPQPAEMNAEELSRVASPVSGDVGVRLVDNSLRSPIEGARSISQVREPPVSQKRARNVSNDIEVLVEHINLPDTLTTEIVEEFFCNGQAELTNEGGIFREATIDQSDYINEEVRAFALESQNILNRARVWFFTSFESTHPDCETAEWAVYQRECTPTTGRLHWQGVVGFNNVLRRSTVQSRLKLNRSHCEVVRDLPRAILYCTKIQTRVHGTEPVIIGNPPRARQSKRDPRWWQRLTPEQLWKEAPLFMLRNHSAVRAFNLCRVSQEARVERRPCEVYLLWGASGTGKTTLACKMAGNERYYVKSITKFWDGYNGERVVIFDDYDGSEEFRSLMRWFDKLPVMVEIKGGSVPLRAEKFIITTNTCWRTWYKADQQDSLHRRFTFDKECDTVWAKPTCLNI